MWITLPFFPDRTHTSSGKTPFRLATTRSGTPSWFTSPIPWMQLLMPSISSARPAVTVPMLIQMKARIRNRRRIVDGHERVAKEPSPRREVPHPDPRSRWGKPLHRLARGGGGTRRSGVRETNGLVLHIERTLVYHRSIPSYVRRTVR